MKTKHLSFSFFLALLMFSTALMSQPVVTSAFPAIGPNAGGTEVVISGTGFTLATDVLFGGTPAPLLPF